jgi:WD40 repeat protein
MAANKVKCPCGTILLVPEGLNSGLFTCSQCGRQLRMAALGAAAGQAVPPPGRPVPAKPAASTPTPLQHSVSASSGPPKAAPLKAATAKAAPAKPAPANAASPRPAPTGRSTPARRPIPQTAPVVRASSSLLPWILVGVLLVIVLGGGLAFWLTRDGNKGPVASGPAKPNEGKGEDANKTGGAPAKAAVPGGGIDLSYISGDFNAAAVLHPKRALQSPLSKALPAHMLEEMVQETGINPRKLEQMIVLLEPLPAGKEPPPTGKQLPSKEPVEAPAGWKEYWSSEGRFAARFPVPPKMESKKGNDGLMGSAVAELPDGTRYEVQYTDFDPAIAAVPKVMLDAVAKQFAADAKAQKDVKVGGHIGTELMVEKGDLAMAMRIYMVKERMYHLLVTSPKSKQNAAQAGQFLNSFRLLEGGAGKEPAPMPPDTPKSKSAAVPISKAGERILKSKSGFVIGLAFSPDGLTLAGGSSDGDVVMWDIPSGSLLSSLRGHRPAQGFGEPVRQVVFSKDGRLMASAGGRDKRAKIWDADTHKELATFACGSHVSGVAFTPDGKTLAVACFDRTIKRFDVDTRQERKPWEAIHKEGVTAVAISPDGKTLASGSEDDEIILWDPQTGLVRTILTGHTGTVESFAFTNDSKLMASASQDRTTRIWDMEAGKLKTILQGHTDIVYGVAFTPDGKTFATASIDKTVKLWDVATGKELKAFAFRDGVNSVAISPNGKLLAASCLDNTVKIFDLPAAGASGIGSEMTGVETNATWKEHRSTRGKFAAKFPVTPKETTQKAGEGMADGHAMAAMPNGVLYEIGYADLPKAALAAGTKFFLDTTAEKLAKDPKSKKEIQFGGHRGVEVEVHLDKDGPPMVVNSRIYVVNERLYELTVTGRKDIYDPAEVKRFFDSFRLLDSGAAKTSAGLKAPSRRSTREQALAWLRTNNTFGPKHKLVDDMAKELDTHLTSGEAFFLSLGVKLVKSKRPTILAGRNGAFYAFEVPADQAGKWLKDFDTNMSTTARQDEVIEPNPLVILDDPKIDSAARLGGGQRLTGTVAYQKFDTFDGILALRLTYMAGNISRTRFHSIEGSLDADKGSLTFSFPPFHDAQNQRTGPTPVFIELCSFLNPERRGKVIVLSNSVAALLNVVESPSNEEEEEEQQAPPQQAGAAPPVVMPFLPATILRFSEPVDGRSILEKNLGFLQSQNFKGIKYFQSQTRKQGGWPLAGYVADDRTLLIAPEPTLHKMLSAAGASGPLLERLQRIDPAAEATIVLLTAPYRPLAAALPPGEMIPGLDLKALPDLIKAVNVAFRLTGDPMLKIEIEAENAKAAGDLHKMAAGGIETLRQLYPPMRESLAQQLPLDLARSALAIADQIYGGLSLDLEGAAVSVTLKRPAALDEQVPPDLIASSGFNDAQGMNSNPVPNSPFPLGTSGKSGGAGERGWAGPWLPAHPAITYQKQVVFEGDGALHLTGVDNVGPGFSRKLAEPQQGVFQVEMHVQVPAGGIVTAYLNHGNQPGRHGPVWQVQGGQFQLVEAGVPPDTGIACQPGKWHKVTLQVDVPRKQWSFLVDDKRFKPRQPLKFRNVNESQIDTLAFLCRTGPGIYLDAVRVTRLPDDTLVKAFARPAVALPPDHIASTGFNNAKGMNSDPEDGPFPLDVPNRAGGDGEPGWAAPWSAHADAVFQSKVVFEGDGALYLKGRPNFGPNYGRRLAEPQTGKFELEYHIQVPAGNSCGAYLWRGAQGGAYQSGPNWSVGGGRFKVSDGDEGGGGKLLDAFPCKSGQWYKVKLRVDVEKRKWEFFVDDQKFNAPRPLGFRTNVEYLDVINFLVEGGVYIDALRVSRFSAEIGS